ncbi:MAG TPA: hypothetical protein PK076_05890 [Saprospiraceae bacterium]|nr:hypothetical protein [Saprospiraceae bacterium]HQW55636.1 hypothetical protein [Saprospiraceae bacterium]
MFTKYFLFWIPMIVLAFANAALRELVLIKYLTELKANQLSTLTLMLLCCIYIVFVYPYLTI